jgi:chromosome segregation ATPase
MEKTPSHHVLGTQTEALILALQESISNIGQTLLEKIENLGERVDGIVHKVNEIETRFMTLDNSQRDVSSKLQLSLTKTSQNEELIGSVLQKVLSIEQINRTLSQKLDGVQEVVDEINQEFVKQPQFADRIEMSLLAMHESQRNFSGQLKMMHDEIEKGENLLRNISDVVNRDAFSPANYMNWSKYITIDEHERNYLERDRKLADNLTALIAQLNQRNLSDRMERLYTVKCFGDWITV